MKQLEVVDTNDRGMKRKEVLQWVYGKLGKRLKGRSSGVMISGLLPVPRECRNRKLM